MKKKIIVFAWVALAFGLFWAGFLMLATAPADASIIDDGIVMVNRWVHEYRLIDGQWYEFEYLEWPWFGTGFDFLWWWR